MGTVIDELIVELKLDPKQFDQASKDQVSKLRQFEREHERHAKKLGSDTDMLTRSFQLLQGRLLAIASLFMGGMGISQFTEHITRLTAQTGYLAQSLGLTTSEITKWQGVGATVGAGQGEMAQAIAAIRQGQADIQIGRPSGLSAFSYMTHQSGQGPAVDPFDAQGRQRNATDILVDISRWLQAQKARGPDAVNNATRTLSSMLGMGQGTINALMLGPEELQKRLKDMEKYAPSAEQVKRFQDLQDAMAKASVAAEALGREVVSRLAPGLTRVFNTIKDFLDRVEGAREAGPAKTALGPMGKGFVGAYDWYTHPFQGMKNLYHYGRRKLGLEPEEPAAPGSSTSAPGGVGGGTQGANDNATGPGSSGAPGKVGRTGWWTPERKQYAVDYLMKNANLPEISARAMVARWAGVESTGRGAHEINSIGATGIAQWLGARKQGVVPGDFEGQLAHVVRELNGSEGRAYRTLMGARDARAAATGASMYERAEGYDPRTGMDNFTGKTIRAMSGIPGGSALRQDGAARSGNQGAATGTFDQMWNSRIGALGGAGAALRAGGGNVTNNTRSSETTIGTMNVTPPPGGDPASYGRGISQELQRYDNVMNANEGLL